MSRALLLGALLLLGACATREGYEARQATLIGRTEAQLVEALGVPDRVHEVEGRRFLQYEERRVIAWGGTPGYAGLGLGYGYGFGRRGYGGLGYGLGYGFGTPPVVETRECDTVFELREGRVIGFAGHGNACVAVPPRPAAG